MKRIERHILAAVNEGAARTAVRVVADRMAGHLAVPVHEVDGGIPVNLLADHVESPEAVLAVFAISPSSEVEGQNDTAFSVARRVTKPMLLVPPTLDAWSGPRQVLVPLDGTGVTAFAASTALAAFAVPCVVATVVHVFDKETVPPFWDNPHYEYEAWTKEFQARYATTIGETVVIRAGPVGDQLMDMAASGAYDLVIVVWSQRTSDGRAQVVVDLLAKSPVPILLVPTSFVAHVLTHRVDPSWASVA